MERIAGAEQEARDSEWGAFIRDAIKTMAWFLRLSAFCVTNDSQCEAERVRVIVRAKHNELKVPHLPTIALRCQCAQLSVMVSSLVKSFERAEKVTPSPQVTTAAKPTGSLNAHRRQSQTTCWRRQHRPPMKARDSARFPV